jgi:hypothetical protein
MPVVQHTSFLPRPRQSVAATCALTTARAMWQRISRYGVTMPGSVFEIIVPRRHYFTILAANGETLQGPLCCVQTSLALLPCSYLQFLMPVSAGGLIPKWQSARGRTIAGDVPRRSWKEGLHMYSFASQ